ncbi:unnamed protein product [Rhizophagus irregularis]|nr:unnamed protein product [Rhizophagus irregularis]
MSLFFSRINLSLRLAGRSCEEQYIKHVVVCNSTNFLSQSKMSSSSTLADREYGMTLRQALELEDHIKGLVSLFYRMRNGNYHLTIHACEPFGQELTIYDSVRELAGKNITKPAVRTHNVIQSWRRHVSRFLKRVAEEPRYEKLRNVMYHKSRFSEYRQSSDANLGTMQKRIKNRPHVLQKDSSMICKSFSGIVAHVANYIKSFVKHERSACSRV